MTKRFNFEPEEFNVEIPEDLYEEAKRAGLLEPETLQILIREHLRRMAGDELMRMTDKCRQANGKLPPMTWDEINASIEEVRREKQGQYEKDTEQNAISGS